MSEKKEMNEVNVKSDPVNPNHYKSSTSLECIEAMRIVFGDSAVLNFCVCNAWKYIWRWKNKNGVEDLNKATWYVDTGIELVGEVPDTYETRNNYEVLGNIRDYIRHQVDAMANRFDIKEE